MYCERSVFDKFEARLRITTINHVCSSLCNFSRTVEISSSVLIDAIIAIICRHTPVCVAIGRQQRHNARRLACVSAASGVQLAKCLSEREVFLVEAVEIT